MLYNIEEENYGRNADLITKHFIAEGVVCGHSILIADVEKKPEIIVSYFVIVENEKKIELLKMY